MTTSDLPAGYDALDPDEKRRYMAASDRYNKAAHAMQSGVAFEHSNGSQDGTAKHLRVGVNSGQVTCEALATLLIGRGLFTLAEYVETLADAMEREVARYEARNAPLRFG